MKSTISIRKIKKEDLIPIFQLEKEAFQPDHYPLFVLRQWYDIFPELFFVAANKSNQILGYCFGGMNPDTKAGWIVALAVGQPAQKNKIGQRLTAALIQAFKNKNVNTIQLTTTPDNIPAIGLYKKLGFKELEEAKDYYLDHTPRKILKLEI